MPVQGPLFHHILLTLTTPDRDVLPSAVRDFISPPFTTQATLPILNNPTFETKICENSQHAEAVNFHPCIHFPPPNSANSQDTYAVDIKS
jgi:hypothetical protein